MPDSQHRAALLRYAVPDAKPAARSAAAATTWALSLRPGDGPSRLTGPDTHNAPSSTPSRSTGALTLATPGSRSATLAAQPRLRTPASSACWSAGRAATSADQASSTLPPQPADNGRSAPTATPSRRPLPAPPAPAAIHTPRAPHPA